MRSYVLQERLNHTSEEPPAPRSGISSRLTVQKRDANRTPLVLPILQLADPASELKDVLSSLDALRTIFSGTKIMEIQEVCRALIRNRDETAFPELIGSLTHDDILPSAFMAPPRARAEMRTVLEDCAPSVIEMIDWKAMLALANILNFCQSTGEGTTN